MNLTDRNTLSPHGLALSTSPTNLARHPPESAGLTPDYYLRHHPSQLASTISVNSVVGDFFFYAARCDAILPLLHILTYCTAHVFIIE
uniref:Uncharacterized protein n=1 Tax=Panagrellus redivivus TaxID=6233 RepID=A0A7E4VVV8_PANRE